MPLYEFYCEVCGEVFTYNCTYKKLNPLKKCKKCGGVVYRDYRVSVKISNPTHPARTNRGKGDYK